jgi:hypothetical protein
MAGFAREAAKVLKDFHRDIDDRARKVGAGIAGLSMLQQQIQVYENILKDVSNTAKEMVNNTQKDINREFTPVVEQAMMWAYNACTAERGTIQIQPLSFDCSRLSRSWELCAHESSFERSR